MLAAKVLAMWVLVGAAFALAAYRASRYLRPVFAAPAARAIDGLVGRSRTTSAASQDPLLWHAARADFRRLSRPAECHRAKLRIGHDPGLFAGAHRRQHVDRRAARHLWGTYSVRHRACHLSASRDPAPTLRRLQLV